MFLVVTKLPKNGHGYAYDAKMGMAPVEISIEDISCFSKTLLKSFRRCWKICPRIALLCRGV